MYTFMGYLKRNFNLLYIARTTITGLYYASIFHRLRDATRENQCAELSKVLFCGTTMFLPISSQLSHQAILECNFIQLIYQPYSAGLTSSDVYLFRHFKKIIRGRRFNYSNDLKPTFDQWLGGHDKKFFQTGLISLE